MGDSDLRSPRLTVPFLELPVGCQARSFVKSGSPKARRPATAKMAVEVGGDRARDLRSMGEIWKESIRTLGETHTLENFSNNLEYGEIPGKMHGRALRRRKNQSRIDLDRAAELPTTHLEGTNRRSRASLDDPRDSVRERFRDQPATRFVDGDGQ
jgi:hypothetical protein